MNPRRRRRSKQRNLALARRLRERRGPVPLTLPDRAPAAQAPSAPALPVRRPGGVAGPPPVPDLKEHQPETSMLHRVRAALAALP